VKITFTGRERFTAFVAMFSAAGPWQGTDEQLFGRGEAASVLGVDSLDFFSPDGTICIDPGHSAFAADGEYELSAAAAEELLRLLRAHNTAGAIGMAKVSLMRKLLAKS
jgi:hypothetical protein